MVGRTQLACRARNDKSCGKEGEMKMQTVFQVCGISILFNLPRATPLRLVASQH